MSATTEEDQVRITLENALACRVAADGWLACALTRLLQTARTEYERETIGQVREARRELAEAKKYLAELHPNGRRTD